MNQSAVVQYALEPLAVELRDVVVPEIGDHDVLLRVGAVSVCGSDVHQAYNTHSWLVNVPVILGHEFVGVIEEVGDLVDTFKPGDRVFGMLRLRELGARIERVELEPQHQPLHA